MAGFKSLVLFSVIFLVAIVGTARGVSFAAARFEGSISGSITFLETCSGPVIVRVNLRGVPDGNHGAHVHELSDLGNACLNTGPHYNPFAVNIINLVGISKR